MVDVELDGAIATARFINTIGLLVNVAAHHKAEQSAPKLSKASQLFTLSCLAGGSMRVWGVAAAGWRSLNPRPSSTNSTSIP